MINVIDLKVGQLVNYFHRWSLEDGSDYEIYSLFVISVGYEHVVLRGNIEADRDNINIEVDHVGLVHDISEHPLAKTERVVSLSRTLDLSLAYGAGNDLIDKLIDTYYQGATITQVGDEIIVPVKGIEFAPPGDIMVDIESDGIGEGGAIMEFRSDYGKITRNQALRLIRSFVVQSGTLQDLLSGEGEDAFDSEIQEFVERFPESYE